MPNNALRLNRGREGEKNGEQVLPQNEDEFTLSVPL